MYIRFNASGHCLITKQVGIKLTKRFKGFLYPQSAKTYDVVEIGHNFQPEKYSTKIITFRDKKGKIIQRNITEKAENEITEVKKNYKEYPLTTIEHPLKLSEQLPVYGRKISSITKKNGQYHSKSEEVQTRTKINNIPVITISKLESRPTKYSGVEYESQSLYEYCKGFKQGYSAENYIRNNHAGIFTFGEFKLKIDNMDSQSINMDNKYFLLHLYTFKQFKRVAPYVIENFEHKPPLVTVKWYNKSVQPDDKTVSCGFYNGNVNLNNKVLTTKIDVVRTSAHEKEHAYQRLERNKPVEQHTEETKKNIEAFNNYTSSDKNFDEYENNYNEQQARKAGQIAMNDYELSLENFRYEFPFAPPYQIS